jgi:hypothetical protein
MISTKAEPGPPPLRGKYMAGIDRDLEGAEEARRAGTRMPSASTPMLTQAST